AAHHLDLEHDLRHVLREHDVAAAAQDELGRAAELAVVDDLAPVGVAADAHERVRDGRQTEGVVGFQAHTRLDMHERIFADSTCLSALYPAGPKTSPMPSFDTVLEPNLVEVK